MATGTALKFATNHEANQQNLKPTSAQVCDSLVHQVSTALVDGALAKKASNSICDTICDSVNPVPNFDVLASDGNHFAPSSAPASPSTDSASLLLAHQSLQNNNNGSIVKSQADEQSFFQVGFNFDDAHSYINNVIEFKKKQNEKISRSIKYFPETNTPYIFDLFCPDCKCKELNNKTGNPKSAKYCTQGCCARIKVGYNKNDAYPYIVKKASMKHSGHNTQTYQVLGRKQVNAKSQLLGEHHSYIEQLAQF